MDIGEKVETFKENFSRVEKEISKVIVGQESIIRGILISLFANGHVLLEGLPGLGKTLMVRTVSEVLNLTFSRIQFTPDLMPADIVGTNIVVEDEQGRRRFQFQRGPIFANVVLADEINRATPKTQSAMLEAMQEHTVSVAGKTFVLEEPFFVLATQNPIEMEGTFPLPEAQLDRFFFKLKVNYPSQDELSEIIDRTTVNEMPKVHKVLDAKQIFEMRWLIREVMLAQSVKEHAIRLVFSTHPNSELAPEVVKRYVRYGSSPRGAQALILSAKVNALLNGRFNVSKQDIDDMALPALRHRMLLNFEGQAEGIDIDEIIQEILQREHAHRTSTADKT